MAEAATRWQPRCTKLATAASAQTAGSCLKRRGLPQHGANRNTAQHYSGVGLIVSYGAHTTPHIRHASQARKIPSPF
eukprot:5294329-Amphidinium_carterae.1